MRVYIKILIISSDNYPGVCNISGWRKAENGTSAMISDPLLALLTQARAAQQECSRHTWPRFVASHRAAAHLHASNDLLRAIIGPGHIRLPVEDPVIGPMFTQTDEQQAQLIQGRQGLIPPGSTLWDLFPEFEQASTTFQGQLGDQEFDFIDHP